MPETKYDPHDFELASETLVGALSALRSRNFDEGRCPDSNDEYYLMLLFEEKARQLQTIGMSLLFRRDEPPSEDKEFEPHAQ